MLNKVLSFIRRYEMISSGDQIVCAVSGGADSIALLFAMYLIKEQLGIELSAAHFNHHLRGEESDRDEAFVRDFCRGYGIPLQVGSAHVVAGEKGLEAAARDARYAFLKSLPGKIATAHTADDNAETVLMHLVRGTGLKGLGAIAPINGNVIRPMLEVTRQDVEAFLDAYHVTHIEDSSNYGDAFLRNRLRHHVMPLLKEENPRIALNLSAMALRLRQDEQALSDLSRLEQVSQVEKLKAMPSAVRARALERFLKESGVKEPEAQHISLAEKLVFSENPSAKANFPGNVTISRNYGNLEVMHFRKPLDEVILPHNGSAIWGDYEISCTFGMDAVDAVTVVPVGEICIRSRLPGDEIRLPGGRRSLKKLFIDRKIPAAERDRVPVLADDVGVLAVCGIGANMDRIGQQTGSVRIQFKKMNSSES